MADTLPSGLSSPARRALAGAGIEKIEDLTSYKASKIGGLHGMGPKALQVLRDELEKRGLDFAPESG